ncbi:MAG: segregation and condensation protein A [Janthinobacterium lividum]
MSEIAPAPTADPDAEPWEEPPRRAAPTLAPMLVADGFEGPLDWLLEMVHAHKIDLARLSILALVESFANVMDAALSQNVPTPELARWAAWTVMASQLAELRSRLLLPADLPEARNAHAEAEALRRQWISRAEMAAAADWLDRRPQLGRDVFAPGRPEPARAGQGAGSAQATTGGSGLAEEDADVLALEERDEFTELMRACLVALRLPSINELYQPRLLPFWSISDATRRISQLLPRLPDGACLEEFLPDAAKQDPAGGLHHRAALAATLVAGLELARGGSITLQQVETWGLVIVADAGS